MRLAGSRDKAAEDIGGLVNASFARLRLLFRRSPERNDPHKGSHLPGFETPTDQHAQDLLQGSTLEANALLFLKRAAERGEGAIPAKTRELISVRLPPLSITPRQRKRPGLLLKRWPRWSSSRPLFKQVPLWAVDRWSCVCTAKRLHPLHPLEKGTAPISPIVNT